MSDAPEQTNVKRKAWWWWALTAASIIVAIGTLLIPGVNVVTLIIAGALVSHLIDRGKNGLQAGAELDRMAEVYRVQIGNQLGMDPDRVTKRDLLLAANSNPQLHRLVEEARRRRGDENRMSGLTSIPAAIPFIGAGAKVFTLGRTAASVGASVGGSVMAGLMTKDRVDPHDAAQAIHVTMSEAQRQGQDPRQAVSANLLFLLRVSQDEVFGKEIKQRFGKDFHKMTDAEQIVVMNHYPALANSSVSEAYAVATGMVPVEELVASPPNLNGMAQSMVPPSRSGGFASRELRRREEASRTANLPSV